MKRKYKNMNTMKKIIYIVFALIYLNPSDRSKRSDGLVNGTAEPVIRTSN